jgi:hypothetical protein
VEQQLKDNALQIRYLYHNYILVMFYN